MKKILGLLLAGIIAIGSTGCESEEEYKERVIETVKTKVETLSAEDTTFSQITNKEWSYTKTEDGQEIVTMNGIITYMFSMPVTVQFYINDGYVSKMVYTFMDDTETINVPKSEKSKLDL